MSGRRAKLNRKKANNNCTINENQSFISKENLIDYLFNFFKRFSGYNFISLSKQDKNNITVICAHKTIPVIKKETNQYISPGCKYICSFFTESSEFQGLVIDKNKNGFYGDPFDRKCAQDDNLPDLGKNKSELDKNGMNKIFNEGVTVEPL